MADQDGLSLSSTIKGLLDTTIQIKSLSNDMKTIRQKRKEEENFVKDAMSEQGLRVVRVMKHSSGPHDFILGERTKKKHVTTKQIKNALAGLQGERIDAATFDTVIEQIQKENGENETITYLKINKLKTEETGKTAEVQ